jgi:hypothetical protein
MQEAALVHWYKWGHPTYSQVSSKVRRPFYVTGGKKLVPRNPRNLDQFGRLVAGLPGYVGEVGIDTGCTWCNVNL